MKALVLAAAANCMVTSATLAEPAADAAKELASYLNAVVAENKLSGVVLVAKDGVTIVSKAAGVANKVTNAPIDLNTKFNLGSMNKMFTAVTFPPPAQPRKLLFTGSLRNHPPPSSNKEGIGHVN